MHHLREWGAATDRMTECDRRAPGNPQRSLRDSRRASVENPDARGPMLRSFPAAIASTFATVMHALSLRAGPDALRQIRERGLRAGDVDIVPAASGGPKWLVLAGLDRYLFGTFFTEPRARPLHLIGSSIGSWRMACFAQRDPLAALDRGHRAYIEDQHYTPKPGPTEVAHVLSAVLDALLGDTGVHEIMTHSWARLHVITSQGRGLAARGTRGALLTAIGGAAALNLVSRRSLSMQFRRVIFDAAGDTSPFRGMRDLPTVHVPLTEANLRDVLRASGSIPLVIDGVRIDGTGSALHWDGGVTDYHLDLDFGRGDGIVLYPHFYPYVVPGWFDKSLPWRRAGLRHFRRALVVAPSAAFVASLPGGRIPDRTDFRTMTESARIAAWNAVRSASAALGDELADLVSSGRIADRIQPWEG